MAEQTFRSPGFFEREIDLASRQQAVSGVPGGLIGTSLKGPAFVPVTIGDFADFVNRFGSLDSTRPASYAAFEFLKKKRALTFMRVLGAGANQTAADRSATLSKGIVKGAGFRVHGKQTTINRKNIAHSDDSETFTSVSVLDGAPFLITGQHKTDVHGKSLWAANTHPVLNDNPSFNADGYASMLRGVVYTAAGYRLSAMGVGDTYTYGSLDPAGDDAKAATQTPVAADANGGLVFNNNLANVNAGISMGVNYTGADVTVYTATIFMPAAVSGHSGGDTTYTINFQIGSAAGDEAPAVAGNATTINFAMNNGATADPFAKTLSTGALADQLISIINGTFAGGRFTVAGGSLITAGGDTTLNGIKNLVATKTNDTGVKLEVQVKGQSGNSATITFTKPAGAFNATAPALTAFFGAGAPAMAFSGGDGDAATMLQTDGLVNLMDAANTITSQTFKLLLIGKDSQSSVHRTITASLDPEHPAYISKVLNTDPNQFTSQKHLLYLDLPVEDEVAPAAKVLVAPPSNQAIGDSPFAGEYGKAWSLLGRLDTRYKTARTPSIISQPFGSKEFDLFHFEALSDGESGNEEVKVSIANLKASLDPKNKFGTFDVLVRRFRDLDLEPEVLEAYPACSLDPDSEQFIARVIGDYKAQYNFDADLEEERRVVVSGKYPNRSLYVRVRLSGMYESGEVPDSALPFGFRGIPVLKTSESLTDSALVALKDGSDILGNAFGSAADLITGDKTRIDTSILIDETNRRDASLASPVFPPLPYRYKVTRGQMMSGSQVPSGHPALTEKVESKLYWGLKSERVPLTGSTSYSILNPNAGGVFNELIHGYTKFQGLVESGALLTGSAVDAFNSNKFTLAKVALNITGSDPLNIASNITGSARDHMLEAVYLRDAKVEGSSYIVTDPAGPVGRVTMATLVSSSSIKFNRFTVYNKFTVPLYGGFDGVNMLDSDMRRLNDRASSADAPPGFFGKASTEFDTNFTQLTGLYEGKPGIGQRNSTVITYREAANIMTDPMTVSHNILAIPGIKDSFVTDHTADLTKEYSLAIYLMDIPSFSEGNTRLFGTEDRTAFVSGSVSSPDVRETAEQFSSRAVDNNYSAAYFPDIVIADEVNSTRVKVPASVAAMKALSFSDSVSFPWFAPAGFNRGALDNVTNVDVRLTAGDRDELYDARINPIANFPDGGIVIFGQKTLQMAKSALDRVNVRRMLLEVKRLITRIAQRLLFEPNNSETRARFINLVTPLLTTVQAQAGIDSFKIVMDDTNNSTEDVENNRLNGRIVVVPTRAIEFIAIDFIITNSGISFE